MITQRLHLAQQDIPLTNLNKLHTLGAIAETADGRIYRYTQNNTTALAAGKVTQALAKVANHTDISVAVAANVGDRQITVTLGATAATQNQYDGGYLVVVEAPGVGQTLRITGNPAAVSAGNLTLQLADPVHTALTTSSKVSLSPNPWGMAALADHTQSGAIVVTGSPVVAVAASYYYWSQTGGTASVLSQGVITKGGDAVVSSTVDGALAAEGTSTITQRVGYAPEATVDTKYYPVYLTVDNG